MLLKIMKALKFIPSNYPADGSEEEERIIKVLLPQNSGNWIIPDNKAEAQVTGSTSLPVPAPQHPSLLHRNKYTPIREIPLQ